MVKVLVWYWLAMKVAEENILKCERTEKSKEICLAHWTCPWKQEKIPIPVGQYELPLQYTSHYTKLKSILPSSYRNYDICNLATKVIADVKWQWLINW